MNSKGFSLIELAIVMTIIGVLLAGAAQLYDIWQKKQRVDLTNARIGDAQEFLDTYVRKNAHYPCPAPIDAAVDTEAYATASDCDAAPPSGITEVTGRDGRLIRIGALPVRTLGASGKAMIDGWDHRFLYAVTKDLAIPGQGFDSDAGAITIKDSDDNIVADGTAHYALVSTGPDGKGAHSINGALVEPCDSSPGKDSDNCLMDDGVFRETEMRSTAPGPHYYDDFVAHAIDADVSGGKTKSARITVGTPFPIPNNDYTAYLKLDKVIFDNGGFYTAPGTLTIPEGVSKIVATANVGYDEPFAHEFMVDALLFCGQHRARQGLSQRPMGENGNVMNLSTGIIPVKPGDTCRIHYFQNSGTTFTMGSIIQGGPNNGSWAGQPVDNWLSVQVVE